MSNRLEDSLLKLKKGDLEGLREIYEQTSRGVFTFILPIIRDYQLAEDIMQETYVKVHDKVNDYQEGTNVRNWILTIAKNLAFDELRRRKHETETDFDDEREELGSYYLSDQIDAPTIKLANEILPEDEMQIVLLFAIGGYKHREIAEMLKLPLGTVTWKYHDALLKLRKAVKK